MAKPARYVARRGDMSDWQLYRRLLRYALPYWQLFLVSVLGFMLYSAGNVLLADLMQFLLDSLGGKEPDKGGLVAGLAYRFWNPDTSTQLEYARIAVPVASVLLAFTRAFGYFVGT